MILMSAKVGPFRSINTAQNVGIDRDVTVLVGMNEAGKTVFLKALHKAQDALGLEKFNPTDDYPRKDYTAYMRLHVEKPGTAVALSYQLDQEEIDGLNAELNTDIEPGFTFSVSHLYNNSKTVGIKVNEASVIAGLASTSGLSTDAVAAIKKSSTLRDALANLSGIDRNEADNAFLESLNVRVEKSSWSNVVEHEVWTHLSG